MTYNPIQEPAPTVILAQPAGSITVTGSTSAGEDCPPVSPAALSWELAIQYETNPMGME
ncbi:hypothetical protein [Azospirillum sp.]|uniref:hypothetical protein n=1 Tax=Azospirillum sp. TaxID=34012 RepID=UPI003D72C88B